MNVALRAVHDALARGRGDPADRWRCLADGLVASVGDTGVVDSETISATLRALGVAGATTEWRSNLRQLGVVDSQDRLDASRAEAVAAALDLAADSFVSRRPASSWAPVATLPPELRSLLRPPPLRHTAGVLLELTDRARHELRIATPFVDPHAVAFLADALLAAGRRGAELRVLTSVGQAVCFDDLAARWRSEPRAALRVTEVHTHLSSLGSHAKVVIVDDEHGYVGSANLTAAGLGRHIEVGVELSGPQVADLAKVLVALERLGNPVVTVAAAVR